MSASCSAVQGISIHALREEGDLLLPLTAARSSIFLSTPSARRATQGSRPDRQAHAISIHALREEGDCCRWGSSPGCVYFYPRPPRGGRLDVLLRAAAHSSISIHALREEGDASTRTVASPVFYFYPRPPRGGRRNKLAVASGYTLFLSTPSARRATSLVSDRLTPVSYFYPRPPRGGRPHELDHGQRAQVISIHALREEGDLVVADLCRSDGKFLSTPSARRATSAKSNGHRLAAFLSTPSARRATAEGSHHQPRAGISIHALREEGDAPIKITSLVDAQFLSTPSARRATTTCSSSSVTAANFYPRPPRGGRLSPKATVDITKLFLSTPSARRATFHAKEDKQMANISIHALREEGDRASPWIPATPANFYPRPPRGGRRFRCPASPSSTSISIHALREEGDGVNPYSGLAGFLFLSTPSARRATEHTNGAGSIRSRFLSTPSARRATATEIEVEILRRISIHALREEGDGTRHNQKLEDKNFYPRPPRGGRQQKQRQNLYFQTNYTTFCTNLEEP